MTQNEDIRKAARGLQFVYAGLIVWLLAAIAEVALTVYSGPQGRGVPRLLILIWSGGVMCSAVLDITGKSQCLEISDRLQATGIVFWSMLCALCSLILRTLGRSALLANAKIAALYQAAAGSVRDLLTYVAYLLFLIFVRRLAQFMGCPQLAADGWTILINLTVAAPLYVGSAAVLRPVAGLGLHNNFAALTVGFVLGVYVFVLLVRYANLLTSLRRATLKHTGPQALV